MNDNDDNLCPVCERQMRVMMTIEDRPGSQTIVLQCRPCGLSTRRTDCSADTSTGAQQPR